MSMSSQEAQSKGFAVIQPWVALGMTLLSAVFAGGGAWATSTNEIQRVKRDSEQLQSQMLTEIKELREEAKEDRDMLIRAINAVDVRLSRLEGKLNQ